MSYQVLARKWRPRLFNAMVGQEHVVRALVNALDNDRLHHAYLFTGTRGVGKTTVARIFAKALNCEQGVSSSPCGVCSACRELDEGRFVDLLEVDAASRTKVEDTRDLLEYVQYAPTRGRFKVYLIDEVHMLSKHSFNALLKTLEEPPPHVKFLLATTDPQRLPVTILSRCLQFNLRRLSEEMIAGHLAHVLAEEAIPADPPAINRIARAADGSVRDALSLLDQAIAYGGGRVADAEVCAMLGTIDRDHVYELLEALADGNGAAMLEAVQRASEYTAEFTDLLDELISALQRVAVAQIVPQAAAVTGPESERVATLAGRLGREDVQLYYQIALLGRRDLPYCPDARTGVEMTLLRMLAFRPADASGRPDAGTPRRAGGQSSVTGPAPGMPAQGGAATSPARTKPSALRPGAVAGDTEWDRIVAGLELQGLVRELAMNCALRAREPGRISLVIDSAHSHLKVQAQRLQRALADAIGGEVTLEISVGELPGPTPAERLRAAEQARREAALEALEDDADVRALRDVFNARILPDSVQPVD